MAKDLIEDIKRPKRSLQDVLPASDPLPSNRVPSPSRFTPPPPSTDDYRSQRREDRPRRTHRRRWPIVFFIFLIVLIPAVFLFSTMFGRATVTVIPRRAALTVRGTYRAISLPASTASSSVLGFQTMTIKGGDSVVLPAGKAIPVSERASGTIVITNRYSQTAQKLVANSRFEAPNGKIYRIKEAILVPGYTLINGVLTPGELTARVTADQPGSDYNNTFATKEVFTIPGFKNDARFKTITARAKISFTGGFVGERKMANPVAQTAAETELIRRLKDRLLAEAASQIPDEYVWYPSAVFWRLGETNLANGGASTTDVLSEEKVKLVRQVELVAPIFSRAELSQMLARQFVPDYDGAPVLIEKIEHLNFQPIGVLSDPERLTDFAFTLEGQGILVWQFNTVALVHDLAGRGSSDYQAMFVKYPSITNSQVAFNPPWLIRFPSDPKRINLTIESLSARMPTTINQRDTPNGN